jgi:hypothetical protein
MENKLGKVSWWDRLICLTCTRRDTDTISPFVHSSIHLMLLLLLLLLCLFVRSCATDDADMLGSHDLKYTLTCALRSEGRKGVRCRFFFSSSFRPFFHNLCESIEKHSHKWSNQTPTQNPKQFDCDEDTTMNKVTLLSGYLRKRNVKGGTLSLKQRSSDFCLSLLFVLGCV